MGKFTAKGYVFIGLNVVRALSIIGLLLVFSSSIVGMVEDVNAVNNFMSAKQSGNSTENLSSLTECDYIEGSTVPNQAAGVFWAVVNRLLIIFQVIALIMAEVGWPVIFFERFFPVLGPAFGLGALGIFQCLIGAAILSHHVDDFALVSAFFLFSIGCLNILLGLIFRESAKRKRSIKEHREESKGVLPAFNPRSAGSPSFLTSSYGDAKGRVSDGYSGSEKASLGFGRQGEKDASLMGYGLQMPDASLPRYAPKAPSAGTQPLRIPSRFSDLTSNHSRSSSHSSHHSHHSHRDSTHSDTESEISDSDEPSHPPGMPVPTFHSSPSAL